MQDSNEYIREQAKTIYQQWEFFQSLTWRIPTTIVSLNVALILLLRLGSDNLKLIDMPLLCLFVGLFNIVNAHRLYRALAIANLLMAQLVNNFDKEYGIEVKRLNNTGTFCGDLKWLSSRQFTYLFLGAVGLVWIAASLIGFSEAIETGS